MSEAAWQQMITPATVAEGPAPPYGFGLGLGAHDGHRAVAHGGGINGFVSQLSYFPDDDLYVAVLVSTPSDVAGSLAEKAARAVLGIPEPTFTDRPIPVDQAAALVGIYDLAAFQVRFEVYAKDAQLFLREVGDPEGPRLRLQDDGSFAIPEIRATFRFAPGAPSPSVEVEQGNEKLTAPRAP